MPNKKDFKIGRWYSLSYLLSIVPAYYYEKLAENLSTPILSYDGGRVQDIIKVSHIIACDSSWANQPRLVVNKLSKCKWKQGRIVDVHLSASRVYVFITCGLYLKMFAYIFGEQR